MENVATDWRLYLTLAEEADLDAGKMRTRRMVRLAHEVARDMFRNREPNPPTADDILRDMGATKTDSQIHAEIVAVLDGVRAEHAAAAALAAPEPVALPTVLHWPEQVMQDIRKAVPRLHEDSRVDWAATFFKFTQKAYTPRRGTKAKSWQGYGAKPAAFRQQYRVACLRGYGEAVLAIVPTLALSSEQAEQLTATCKVMVREGERLRGLPSYDAERY